MLYALLKKIDGTRYLFSPVLGYEKIEYNEFNSPTVIDYLPIILWYNDVIGPVYSSGSYQLVTFLTEKQKEIENYKLNSHNNKLTKDGQVKYDVVELPKII